MLLIFPILEDPVHTFYLGRNWAAEKWSMGQLRGRSCRTEFLLIISPKKGSEKHWEDETVSFMSSHTNSHGKVTCIVFLILYLRKQKIRNLRCLIQSCTFILFLLSVYSREKVKEMTPAPLVSVSSVSAFLWPASSGFKDGRCRWGGEQREQIKAFQAEVTAHAPGCVATALLGEWKWLVVTEAWVAWGSIVGGKAGGV